MSYRNKKQSRAAQKSFQLILFLIFLFILNISHAQQIDLLLKGGHVIDPKNKIDGQMDVAITNGKISAVAKDISAKDAKESN